eukprot:295165_1
MSSNVGAHLRLQDKPDQFKVIREIVYKYNAPSQQQKLCNKYDILDVDRCTYIKAIINALKDFNKGNIGDINISDVLCAYDHVVSVHNMCHISKDNQQEYDDEQLYTYEKEEISTPFEEFANNYNDKNDAQKYITKVFNGYCKFQNCVILKNHIMRRREAEMKQQESDDTKDALQEILMATLNALHCYTLHEKKQLFRLQRENGKSHFITSIIDEHVINESKDSQESTSTAIPSLNFGVSVLKWLIYSELPKFKCFRDEMIKNPESTIDAQMFLIYGKECFIKQSNNKYEQYLLKELMALKMYTDTNAYQSCLRKSFWKSSGTELKKLFYHWALELYKTSLFHAIPIPRWSIKSKAPQPLFHGLNKVFVLDNARPKYNGPTSTSLEESVAHSFSKGTGLFWTIKSSYANQFKCITGIAVDWISQHKNEREVLLMDQYLPIVSATNFDDDPANNVDHLLYSIKSYKRTILNKRRFFNILGI